MRTYETYLEHIKILSKSSIRNFHCAYKSFNGIEDLIASNPSKTELYDTIQRWINNATVAPSTLAVYFSVLSRYFYYRGIVMTPLDIKFNLRFPRKVQDELKPLTREKIAAIIDVASLRRKLLYLAHASSGMRIGELLQLRKKDIDTEMDRMMAIIPAKITKTKRGRVTFFSSEVTPKLRRRLEQIDDDDLVFGRNRNVESAKKIEEDILTNILRKIGLDQRYESNGRHEITSHSFRAFFITQFSRCDVNIAKLLSGQKGYMLQYDRLTPEEKLKYYIQYENALLISDQSKNEKEIERLKEETRKIAILERENAHLYSRMRALEERFSAITGLVEKVT